MLRVWLVLVCSAGFGTFAAAQEHPLESEYPGVAQLSRDFPTGSIQTPEQVAQVLTRVPELRGEMEREYVKRQNACNQKFFVTRCLDQARQARDQAKNLLGRIESEADLFRRQQIAADKEKSIAERQAQEAAKVPEHEAKARAQSSKAANHAHQQQEQAGNQQQRAAKALQKRQQVQGKIDQRAQARTKAAEESAEKQQKYEEKLRNAERKVAEREKRLANKAPAGQ